jgi:hypothetical protein
VWVSASLIGAMIMFWYFLNGDEEYKQQKMMKRGGGCARRHTMRKDCIEFGRERRMIRGWRRFWNGGKR